MSGIHTFILTSTFEYMIRAFQCVAFCDFEAVPTFVNNWSSSNYSDVIRTQGWFGCLNSPASRLANHDKSPAIIQHLTDGYGKRFGNLGTFHTPALLSRN